MDKHMNRATEQISKDIGYIPDFINADFMGHKVTFNMIQKVFTEISKLLQNKLLSPIQLLRIANNIDLLSDEIIKISFDSNLNVLVFDYIESSIDKYNKIALADENFEVCANIKNFKKCL
jgi:hypothetical protein